MIWGSGWGLTMRGLPPHVRPLLDFPAENLDKLEIPSVSHPHSCLPFAHRVRLSLCNTNWDRKREPPQLSTGHSPHLHPDATIWTNGVVLSARITPSGGPDRYMDWDMGTWDATWFAASFLPHVSFSADDYKLKPLPRSHGRHFLGLDSRLLPSRASVSDRPVSCSSRFLPRI